MRELGYMDAAREALAEEMQRDPTIFVVGEGIGVRGGNFGTTTLPTGSEATASISDPNSMRGPIGLPYKIAQQRLQGYISVAAACGGLCPDGWSVAIRNCTGAALSTGCVVAYRAISDASA